MASLVWDDAKRGRRARILFLLNDRRRTIRLGKVPTKVAQEWKRRVEELLANLVGGVAADAPLAAWLRDLPDEAHERLSRVGLVAARVREKAHTLDDLITAFTTRAAVKPGTSANYAQTLDSLRVFYGADRPVSAITAESAEEWKKAIESATQGEGRRKKKRVSADGRLAPATVSKRVRVAKQLFAKGVAWGWLHANPFRGLKAGSQANRLRLRYIDLATIDAVLEACPNSEWRTLVAICRFAGLRCPSEPGGLTWADIDWAKGIMMVRSPKTEHHGPEHAVRPVPISPRLRRILAEAFEAAVPGQTHVVPMATRQTANLRTAFQRIVLRAGYKPWPRLFQNLRTSCETDWATRHPAHAVTKWTGHSLKIAEAHYLITTDNHFRAVTETPEEAYGGGAHYGARMAQNPAQRSSASLRNDSQDDGETEIISADYAISPRTAAKVENSLVGPV